MPDPDETSVVRLRNIRRSPEGWSQREHEAQLIAKLSLMPALEYERARNAAARQLKCRVVWLDHTVEAIRARIAEFAHLLPPKDGRTAVGTPIIFHDEGKRHVGFLIAAARRHGQDHHLLVLADGNATVVDSVPLCGGSGFLDSRIS
jgi:hypothetical protein